MSDPNQPPQNPDPHPSGPPTEGYGSPPPGGFGTPQPPGQAGWGAPPPGQQAPGQPGWGPPPPGQQFAQPAAQPYTGGYYGPDWIPELGVRLGSVGARIGAKAIDIVIVIVVNLAIGFAAAAAIFASDSDLGSTYLDTGGNLAASFVIGLVTLAFDFLYNVVIVSRAGGQPGKLMVGLRIVRADGAPLDFRTAFLRWTPALGLGVLSLVPIVSLFSGLARFVLLIVNLVLVCSDGRRQSVFDKIAGTYVVATR